MRAARWRWALGLDSRRGSPLRSVFNPNLQVGAATNLLDWVNTLTLPIGLGVRRNLEHGVTSVVPGFAVKGSFYSLGVSYYEEDIGPYVDDSFTITESRKNLSLVAGLRLGNLLVDYSFYAMEYEGLWKYNINSRLGTLSSFEFRV